MNLKNKFKKDTSKDVLKRIVFKETRNDTIPLLPSSNRTTCKYCYWFNELEEQCQMFAQNVTEETLSCDTYMGYNT